MINSPSYKNISGSLAHLTTTLEPRKKVMAQTNNDLQTMKIIDIQEQQTSNESQKTSSLRKIVKNSSINPLDNKN